MTTKQEHIAQIKQLVMCIALDTTFIALAVLYVLAKGFM